MLEQAHMFHFPFRNPELDGDCSSEIPRRFPHLGKWIEIAKVLCTACLLLAFGSKVLGADVGGSWSVEATLETQTSSSTIPLDWESVLTVSFDPGGIALASMSTFGLSGLESQVFTGVMTIDLWEFYSELSFAPLIVGFEHWSSTVSIALGGAQIQSTFFLSYLDTLTYLSVSLSGSAGDMDVSITSQLETQELLFAHTYMSISGLGFGCVDDIGAAVRIHKTGFEYASLSIGEIPLAGFAGLTLGLEVKFTTTRKSVSISLDWVGISSPLPCLTVYTALGVQSGSSTGISIGSIVISGLELSFDLGAVSLRSVTALSPAYAATLLGTLDSGYWELLELSGTLDACCGGEINWSMATYFSTTSTALFGWAESELSISVPFTDSLISSLEATIQDSGLTEITLAIQTSW